MAEAEDTVERPGAKKKKREDIERKLEEFYRELESAETAEVLQDIRRMAEESRQLLRKVDTLLEILMEAAESEEEEEEKKVLTEIVQELHDLKEALEKISALEHVLDGISETQKDILEQIKLVEASLGKSIDTHFAHVSEDLERLKEVLPVLDEVRSYIKRQMEEREFFEKEIEVMEREIAALSDALNAFQRLVKGDIEERRKAMADLKGKTEEIVAKLVQLRTIIPEEHGKRMDALESRLKTLLESVQTLLEAVRGEEEEQRKMLESFMETVRSRIEDLSSKVEALHADIETAGKEDLDEIRKEISRLDEQISTLVSLIQKNGEALKAHSSEVAEILMRLHALSEQIDAMEKEVTRRISIVSERLKKFEEVDALIRDLMQAMERERRAREESVARMGEEMKKTLAMVHAEISTILDALTQNDVLRELREVRNDLKALLDASKEGRATEKEISAKLAEISRRLAEIEEIASPEDVENALSSLKEIHERLTNLEKRIGKATAVLTDEDLRTILRDLEEVRAKVRLLRDAGIYSEMERLLEELKKLKNAEIIPAPGKIASEAKKLSRTAELVGSVAKEKAKLAADLKKAAKKMDSTAATLVLRQAARIERASKAMREIERLSKSVEKKVRELKGSVERKTPNVVVDPSIAAAKIVRKYVRKLKPGKRVSDEEIARRTGLSVDAVRDALSTIERSGEVRIKVHRPLFFGRWYVERLR